MRDRKKDLAINLYKGRTNPPCPKLRVTPLVESKSTWLALHDTAFILLWCTVGNGVIVLDGVKKNEFYKKKKKTKRGKERR